MTLLVVVIFYTDKLSNSKMQHFKNVHRTDVYVFVIHCDNWHT